MCAFFVEICNFQQRLTAISLQGLLTERHVSAHACHQQGEMRTFLYAIKASNFVGT